jgi:hypothetical protein
VTDTVDIAARRPVRLPMLPAAIVAYAAMAVALWPAAYTDMLHVYAQQLVVLPIVLGLGLPVAALLLSPREPLSWIAGFARDNSLRLIAIALLALIGLAAFTTFKLGIPKLVPFYADPFFAEVDAALHFGDPGRHLHAVVPQWLQYPIGFLYGPAWFLLWFSFIAFVAAHPDRDLRRRYFWSMALALSLLGTVAALAFSSVGPVLYERVYHVDRFADLMAQIRGSAVGEYMELASGYLFENYADNGSRPGTGISAMPSVHLAVATLNALLLTRFGRIAGAIGWAYVGVILAGSVYLGWHYAIDGYVSIAVVGVIWRGVDRLCRGRA